MRTRSQGGSIDDRVPPSLAGPGEIGRPASRSPRRLRGGATEDECRSLLLENLDFIERTVRAIARRNALSHWEADDLAGQVKLRLISGDYAVFRKFRGKSQLTTYLTTVIQNIFRDFRIQQWGKWRPSAAAKRCGEVGVQLEALLYRDGFTVSEAFELLRTRFGVDTADRELHEIVDKLRPRTTRRFESDVVLSSLSAPERGDRRVVDGERLAAQERVSGALKAALAGLSAEDRLILKLRFADGLTIRAIAKTLGLDQRRIYGRVRKLLSEVRARIVEAGVRCEEALELLDWPACEIEAGLGDPDEHSQKTA